MVVDAAISAMLASSCLVAFPNQCHSCCVFRFPTLLVQDDEEVYEAVCQTLLSLSSSLAEHTAAAHFLAALLPASTSFQFPLTEESCMDMLGRQVGGESCMLASAGW